MQLKMLLRLLKLLYLCKPIFPFTYYLIKVGKGSTTHSTDLRKCMQQTAKNLKAFYIPLILKDKKNLTGEMNQSISSADIVSISVEKLNYTTDMLNISADEILWFISPAHNKHACL